MSQDNYQYGYSKLHADTMFNIDMRNTKANKIISVLEDYHDLDLKSLTLLDIGCSTGIIANLLSARFKQVIGIDIDDQAIAYATENFQSENLQYKVEDAMNPNFEKGSFDVIVCNHIYEHVPDYNKLLSSIHNLLKPGGVCYFAAGNRLNLIEGHYMLPFLSMLPKPVAHLYLRILGKGKIYYENHLSLWGLKKLVSRFDIIDYTIKVIANPKKYGLTDIVKENSLKQRIGSSVLKRIYWLCPTYIWILKKN